MEWQTRAVLVNTCVSHSGLAEVPEGISQSGLPDYLVILMFWVFCYCPFCCGCVFFQKEADFCCRLGGNSLIVVMTEDADILSLAAETSRQILQGNMRMFHAWVVPVESLVFQERWRVCCSPGCELL